MLRELCKNHLKHNNHLCFDGFEELYEWLKSEEIVFEEQQYVHDVKELLELVYDQGRNEVYVELRAT